MDFIRKIFMRRRVEGLYGAYLDPAVVKALVDAKENSRSGAAEQELTAFFASVHDYVGLAEAVPLKSLPEIMNAYFNACTDAIQSQGGTLDKFVGDAVVARFEAGHHALATCRAALEVQRNVGELRSRWRQEPDRWPVAAQRLRVRIGINSGVALVGQMGAKTHYNFTMMGDEVNLAARLEGAAKSFGVAVLCSGATQRACEQAKPGHVLFRSLGRILVKGRKDLVELFEPIALAERATERERECTRVFERGIEWLRGGDAEKALQAFGESAPLERDQPDDTTGVKTNPSLVFIETVRGFQRDGVPAWGGV